MGRARRTGISVARMWRVGRLRRALLVRRLEVDEFVWGKRRRWVRSGGFCVYRGSMFMNVHDVYLSEFVFFLNLHFILLL